MSDELAARVTGDVAALAAFVTRWVAGSCPRDEALLERELLARLAPGFHLVMPGGTLYDRDSFARLMRATHGASPGFAIAIRNTRIRHRLGDVLVVFYEEWQRGATRSTPPDNGRWSTAVYRDLGAGFELLHLHETWMPAEVMAAGDYRF